MSAKRSVRFPRKGERHAGRLQIAEGVTRKARSARVREPTQSSAGEHDRKIDLADDADLGERGLELAAHGLARQVEGRSDAVDRLARRNGMGDAGFGRRQIERSLKDILVSCLHN